MGTRFVTDGDVRPEVKILRGGIYSRQSKDKTKSIDEQDDECLTDAEDEGITVVGKYSDGVSASRFSQDERPDWDRLLSDLDAGLLDVLILWESSRGDRDAETWIPLLAKCRRQGILIRITSHFRTYDPRTPADWKQLATEGIDAEYESAKTSLRLRRAMRSSARKGKPHAKCPFGYVRLYDPNNGKFTAQVLDDRPRDNPSGPWTPAEIVKFIFDSLASGESQTKIANTLNTRQIPPPRKLAAIEQHDQTPRKYKGRKKPLSPADRWDEVFWEPAVIRHIAVNKAYLGHRVHNQSVTNEEAWPQLVEPMVFLTVNNKLTEVKAELTRSCRAKYLLSCIASCDVCDGDIIFLKPAQDHDDDRRNRRQHASYRCRKSHAAVPALEFDEYVELHVLELLSTPACWDELLASSDGDDERIAQARLMLEKYQSELAEWRAALESDDPDERPSVTAFTMRERKLLADIDEAKRTMRPRGVDPAVLKFIGKSAREVATLWYSGDLDFRRSVLRAIVDIKVLPVGKGRRNVAMKDRVRITRIHESILVPY